jgi:hypothetical protein
MLKRRNTAAIRPQPVPLSSLLSNAPNSAHKKPVFTLISNEEFLLFLRWFYSPMRTLASLMDFSQSALFFDPSFPFSVLHLLISVHGSTIGFLVVLLVDFPGDYSYILDLIKMNSSVTTTVCIYSIQFH